MNTKQRFLTALNREKSDRLPVTTHHLMPYYLENFLEGKSKIIKNVSNYDVKFYSLLDY